MLVDANILFFIIKVSSTSSATPWDFLGIVGLGCGSGSIGCGGLGYISGPGCIPRSGRIRSSCSSV
jgi:hypothetical protein